MLLDAHTHLDHYDDATLDAALDEIAAQHILAVTVTIDPSSYARACRSPPAARSSCLASASIRGRPIASFTTWMRSSR